MQRKTSNCEGSKKQTQSNLLKVDNRIVDSNEPNITALSTICTNSINESTTSGNALKQNIQKNKSSLICKRKSRHIFDTEAKKTKKTKDKDSGESYAYIKEGKEYVSQQGRGVANGYGQQCYSHFVGNSSIGTSREEKILDSSNFREKRSSALALDDSIFNETTIREDDELFAELNVTDMALSTEERKKLTFYGLPLKVKDILKDQRGITNLYDWQHECLSLPAIKRHDNVIYSLPTSGGKTLVAEILIMKELLLMNKNVILVLPYVAIVQEKVRTFSPFAVTLGFHVEEYAASKGCFPPKKRQKRRSLFLATIEKANSIVNSLIENDRMWEVGMVVVDELHMIGDDGIRGGLLETLLTKLIYNQKHIQLIGMSATIGNMHELKTFMNAELYYSNFRPVQLQEMVKVNDKLYKLHPDAETEEDLFELCRKITHTKHSLDSDDPDHILPLVTEIIPNFSCLVFCATKKHCENLALLLSKLLPPGFMDVKKEERRVLLRSIQNAANGLCKTLLQTIPFGVAYHHSGLTMDERKLIEDAYSSGTLCLLCCTSTLAAGVNLPAKRVLLRSPYVGSGLMSRNQYKQMTGRAGRAGIDSSGESILIVSEKEKFQIAPIVKGPCGSCQSSLLFNDGKGLKSIVLSLLGLKICHSEVELMNFFKITLYYQQNGTKANGMHDILIETVRVLKEMNFVADNKNTNSLCTTNLGQAAYKANIDLHSVNFIVTQLRKSLESLVLTDNVHLLYLVTPLDQVDDLQVNWMLYYKQVSKLPSAAINAITLVGIKESFLVKKATGRASSKVNLDEFVYKRFYLSLMLHEILSRKTIWEVAARYSVSRGFLQNLLLSTMSFTSSLIRFTEEMEEFWALKLLFETLLKKLSCSSQLELEELMEIPGIKQARARQLCKKGYRTIKSLAQVAPEILCEEIEHLPKKQAYLIITTAKMMLQDRAEALREEADSIDI